MKIWLMSLCQVNAKSAVEVETLNQALRLANEEVMKLRRQCDELLSNARRPKTVGARSPHPLVQQQRHNDHDLRQIDKGTNSPSPQNRMQPQKSRHIPDEIAALTEEEAKDALAVRVLMISTTSTSCMNLKVDSSCPVPVAIFSSRRHGPARGTRSG